MDGYRAELLEAAAAIGRTLCRDAWYDRTGRHCNWMGRQDIQDGLLARYSVRAAALGPELYGGSAGIALFLTELHRATGDPAFAATARAALRRSVRYMQRSPTGASPLSFFAGHLGLLWAACRLTDAAAGADLADEMGWLAACVLDGMATAHTLDVISGNAGAIPVLLALSRRPGYKAFADLAVACGEELCREASWSGEMCWWDSGRLSGTRDARPATGFSHGASGCGLALMALHAATGDGRFLRTARGAFAFEDSLYSPAAGNWVDTRFPYRAEEGEVQGTFQRGWCHGGPGIAIARMLAALLDPEMAAQHRRMAEAGVRVAGAALSERLTQTGYDATLCHGIAGLSEVLLMYGDWFDGSCRQRAVDAALALVRRYGASGGWPSGVNAGGPNPSLMIGTAGIGYHLLRLCDPTVPPVLALMLTPGRLSR
ncbi:lantibiotic modifying enzyme [Symbiobacterium terraclitae]|uniref:Lantibiotic modifying enzyme n=1 Tax=Symbiobacterium terraclitae TaxID=557451 RepID=A0ABS4JXA6_9FIRM|nr:lanthionine synthetase LanC family protein [Symbiobacterium terraclitae]MBP2019531.1 lantibiotic modifying enzyme [Symbiobacterium terraclitae]